MWGWWFFCGSKGGGDGSKTKLTSDQEGDFLVDKWTMRK
jgi:hypothetical protein